IWLADMAANHEHDSFGSPRSISRMHRLRGQRALESNRSRSSVLAKALGQIGFEALLFGYFLLSQQEKVTAGGARPAGSHAVREA
ncbi:MAG TPA: hypothetical protein VLE94_08300, partial [Burkholderiaceae bacterium]|nr:hypothetical protein [Burkholderiaceae bacterium]